MDTKVRIGCLPPVINSSSRVLILGSMPSVQSLRLRQYYGHPQNHFWNLIAALFVVKLWRDYDHKLRTLLKHHLALWDVIDSCNREGSADSRIKAVRINDFDLFLQQYPNLQAIACDSGMAYRLFIKFYSDLRTPVIQLPSPSPAYTLPFAKKLIQWKKLLRYLD